MMIDIERGNVLIVDDAVSMGRMRDALFAGGVHYVGIDAEWPPNRSKERGKGGLSPGESGQNQGNQNLGNGSGQNQGNVDGSGQIQGNVDGSGQIQGNGGQNLVSLVQIATDTHVFLVDMYACATKKKGETQDPGGEQELCDDLGGILRRLFSDSSDITIFGYGIAHDLSQPHTPKP
jgi:hypothetical protein